MILLEGENISDGVELLLDRPVRIDVQASYLPRPNALSKTLRQHVNVSHSEHMRSKTSGRQSPSHAWKSVPCMEQVRESV